MNTQFKPCWWLPNGHLQTLAATSLSFQPKQTTVLEELDLPDQDKLELHWSVPHTLLNENTPIILLMHGLEGSMHSAYIQSMLRLSKNLRWRTTVLHFRGSNGRTNRIPQSYHAGKTDDLIFVLHHIKKLYPNAPCVAIGYSLGGNALLKFLGENPKQHFLQAAIAVSVPFDLKATCQWMHEGIRRLYEYHFVKKLKFGIQQKIQQQMLMPVDMSRLNKIKTLYDFDDQVTAPLHGFNDAEDYYQRCSSQQFLSAIQTPTVIIHALDDPLIPSHCIPKEKNQVSIEWDIQTHGGHVGFISGGFPGHLNFWLETRIPHFLNQFF